MEFLKKHGIQLLAGALAVFFVLITVLLFPQFYTTYDSLIGFAPANFSNSITAEQPARIQFKVTQNNFGRCYLRLSANTEAGLNTPVRFTLTDSAGTVLFCHTYPGDQLYGGKYINIVPDTMPQKGESRMRWLH